jgi:hypothetical protein
VDVDPTGEYIVAGGKLATVIPVHSFSKMIAAIEAEDFEQIIDGIPVLKYESVIAGEVENRASVRSTPSSTAAGTPTPRRSSPPRS